MGELFYLIRLRGILSSGIGQMNATMEVIDQGVVWIHNHEALVQPTSRKQQRSVISFNLHSLNKEKASSCLKL